MIIHPKDNVEVGEDGHKYARCPIVQGDDIVKYGMPIGHATAPIAQGEHVHCNNLATNLKGELEYEYHPDFTPVEVHCTLSLIHI